MNPELDGNNVRANCPNCGGAVTTFEFRNGTTNQEYGHVTLEGQHRFREQQCAGITYRLLRCVQVAAGVGLLKFTTYITIGNGLRVWSAFSRPPSTSTRYRSGCRRHQGGIRGSRALRICAGMAFSVRDAEVCARKDP
jgi:hypothetical protein